MIKSILIALILLATLTGPLTAADSCTPTGAERARWTMSDMLSLRTALEAYAQDNKAYPTVTGIDELRKQLEGKYMLVAPVRDAWGTPYRYERNGDGFRLVSAGADAKFDASAWSTAGRLKSLSDDAVMSEQGRWLFRSWSFE
ncbi:MAG TPA: type II secretion system protein GspG [Thermoanaerobaculia bacterium]|nr:type II secretion system protein GspG [Thermoanaerobaculia bacterium]